MAQNNLLRKHVAQRTHVNHAGAGLCLVTGRAVPHDRAGKANLTGGLQHGLVIAAVRRAEVGLRRDTEDAHNLVLVALQLLLHALGVQGGQVGVVVGVVRNLNLPALNQRTENINVVLETHVRGVNKEGQASIRTLGELGIAANSLGAGTVVNRPRDVLALTHESVAHAGPLARLINRVTGDGLGRRVRGYRSGSNGGAIATGLVGSKVAARAVVVVIRLVRAGCDERKHSGAEHKKSAVRL